MSNSPSDVSLLAPAGRRRKSFTYIVTRLKLHHKYERERIFNIVSLHLTEVRVTLVNVGRRSKVEQDVAASSYGNFLSVRAEYGP